MSCRVCSRVKENGYIFLEGAWLYDDEKFKDALTVRLYLTNDDGKSFLRGTLEGTEIEPPLMTAEIAITHCPFCGEELNGECEELDEFRRSRKGEFVTRMEKLLNEAGDEIRRLREELNER